MDLTDPLRCRRRSHRVVARPVSHDFWVNAWCRAAAGSSGGQSISPVLRRTPRYALPTQLNFLFQRADQVKHLAQLSLFQRVVVADFMLDKDPLFAELTLAEDELALYRRLYVHLQPQSPRPDLVLALQASSDTCSHVRQRGIRYEQAVGADYLVRPSDAYIRLFHRYDAAPVLFVNTDGLNFVDNPGPPRLVCPAHRPDARQP